MIHQINYFAVIAATVSSLVVGSIWYAQKVLGNTWIRLAKVTPGEKYGPVWPIVITVIVSFITAWVLAGASHISYEFYQGSFLVSALLTGLVLWAGFTAARFITHDAFEGRPVGLTVLNCAHELVTIVVMLLIIGVWPPALG